MSAHHDLDRQLTVFLVDGPTTLPDASFDAVRDRTEQTRQRVVLGPWRVPALNKLVPIGLGAAAVIAVLFLGSRFIGSPTSNVGGPASQPPASAAPSEAPASAAPTSATSDFLAEGPVPISDPPSSAGVPPVTVTIPSTGWTSISGWAGISKGVFGEGPTESAIVVWAQPAGTEYYVYGDPCLWASTVPDTPVTTVDTLVGALVAQPSLDASDSGDVTVGGHAGKRLTLHVPDDATLTDCDRGWFASYGLGDSRDEPERFVESPGQVDELWILDVDGAIVIIDATYRPDTPADRIHEMRTIAESATFDAP